MRLHQGEIEVDFGKFVTGGILAVGGEREGGLLLPTAVCRPSRGKERREGHARIAGSGSRGDTGRVAAMHRRGDCAEHGSGEKIRTVQVVASAQLMISRAPPRAGLRFT